MKTIIITTILVFNLNSLKSQSFNPNLAAKLQEVLEFNFSTKL